MLHVKAFRVFGIINFIALPTQCFVACHYQEMCSLGEAVGGDIWGLGPWISVPIETGFLAFPSVRV